MTQQIASETEGAANPGGVKHKAVAVPLNERRGFSPREFSALFHKEATWAYRLIYAGRIKAVQLGSLIIPATEVERLLGEATTEHRPCRPARRRNQVAAGK